MKPRPDSDIELDNSAALMLFSGLVLEATSGIIVCARPLGGIVDQLVANLLIHSLSPMSACMYVQAEFV